MKICVLLLGLLATVLAATDQDRLDKLEFNLVTRELDLTSALVKEKTTLVIENKDSKSISHFLFTVQRGASDKLAYIGGQVSSRGNAYLVLVIRVSFGW